MPPVLFRVTQASLAARVHSASTLILCCLIYRFTRAFASLQRFVVRAPFLNERACR